MVSHACRWEGNPSRNIRILRNTVNQCPYMSPNGDPPAISVYAGDDSADSTEPIMHDVEVRGNLVIGSLVCPACLLCSCCCCCCWHSSYGSALWS